MQHEEIITREDGSKIRVMCIYHDGYVVKAKVDGVMYPEWEVHNHLTPAEIHAAKLKCWEKLKP